MLTIVTELIDYLASLPVDTQEEQSLLRTLECENEMETILITGNCDAAPCTLLPLDEQLFEAEDDIRFPLIAEYGEIFSVQVLNQHNETERYATASDFRKFCAGNLRQVRRCTVQIPSPLLRQQRLVYFQFDEELSGINEIAKGCSGCIIALPANAGGLSTGYMDLCRWLKDERCISERVNLILVKQIPFVNRMLPIQAEKLLNRKKMASFECGKVRGAMPCERALNAALLDLQERSAGNDYQNVLTVCCTQVTQKLQNHLQMLQSEAEESGRLAAEYRKAEKTFRAMCDSEKYSLAALLTEEDIQGIRGEIHSMFQQLKVQFPLMVDEVIEKSSDPKKELKELSGDYLGSLSDAFLHKLMFAVSEQLLETRITQKIENIRERFLRMMTEAQLDAQELENHMQAELLRTSNINIGEYQPAAVAAAATLLTLVLRLCMYNSLLSIFGPGNWIFSYNIANYVGDLIEKFVIDAAVAVMPKKMFADAYCKKVLEEWDALDKSVSSGVENNILPRLISALKEEFEKLIDNYSVQLSRTADVFSANQDELNAQAENLLKHIARLENMSV